MDDGVGDGDALGDAPNERLDVGVGVDDALREAVAAAVGSGDGGDAPPSLALNRGVALGLEPNDGVCEGETVARDVVARAVTLGVGVSDAVPEAVPEMLRAADAMGADVPD
jgi:hypothetical protein